MKSSRALRAEALEGRMMLSTASPMLSPGWAALQVGGELDDQTWLPAQQRSIATITPIEGGYVFGGYFATDSGSGTWRANDHLNLNITIDGILTQNSTVSLSGTLHDWSSYDASGTGGFVLRVFTPLLITRPVQSISEPQPSGNTAEVVPSEGGLISINPFPGPSNPINEMGRTDSALARSPGQMPPNGHSAPKGAASTFGSISGEWARAAVFEIAGGEPVDRLRIDDSQSEAVVVTDSFPADGSDEEAVATEGSRREARRLGKETTVEANEKPVSTSANETASNPPLAGLSVSMAREGNEIGVQLPTAVLSNGVAPSAGSIMKPVDAPSELAVEAAFEQIGEGESAIPMSPNERVRLDNWLSGAPLLLMLALERVTARNSRRRLASANTVNLSRPCCR
jgi:hypothetical protein